MHLLVRRRKFESYLKSAYIFNEFFSNGEIFDETMPLITEIAIQEEATAKLVELQQENLTKILDSLEGMDLPGFPARQAVEANDDLGYVPRLEIQENLWRSKGRL